MPETGLGLPEPSHVQRGRAAQLLLRPVIVLGKLDPGILVVRHMRNAHDGSPPRSGSQFGSIDS